MRRLICGLLGFVAIILLVVSDIAPAQALSSKRPTFPCQDTIRVKMGEKLFSFPRKGRVALVCIDPGKISDLCNVAGPVELKSWSADILYGLLLNDLEGKSGDYGVPLKQYSFQLGASYITPQTHKNFQTLYEDVQELMRAMGIKLENLPVENGFYVWRKEDRRTKKNGEKSFEYMKLSKSARSLVKIYNIYVSQDLRSPIDEPAVFVCEESLSKEKVVETEKCWIRVFDGEVNYFVGSIKTKFIPKEQWKELYENFLSLRKSLLLKAPESSPE